MPSPKLILVVEDDSSIRQNLKKFLEYEGYLVQLSKNGRDALDFLSGCVEPPSAILLDLMMPILDGWEFREEQLRSRHKTIPVIVLTAAGVNSAPISADAILRKPVDLDVLANTIQSFVQ